MARPDIDRAILFGAVVGKGVGVVLDDADSHLTPPVPDVLYCERPGHSTGPFRFRIAFAKQEAWRQAVIPPQGMALWDTRLQYRLPTSGAHRSSSMRQGRR